ncbi:uncharacterized SAM-binding protein YcdF (DUF218 family) [Anoxybacillus voinovskiensis]|uniref:Uncharacterized SAM-binding protein YcdF (DUF218 family) n=1 Tax=Anoxybacteroides voinovskiense TaxID=230470 RepID=A0A840DLP4_9BACL|nr:YdcF family protein [Anoxybacillus voinovskiensis]MBB4073800.1 uncharacterized SAM-binding protein YcdF (DUF218 family) [Anoxybacillus voinovskiensis]
MKRKKMVKWFIWLWILLLLANGALIIISPSFLTAVGQGLVVEDDLNDADVIIVFGGGEGVERVKYAVDLYEKGYAKRIMLSGGMGHALTSVPWAVRMKEQLVTMGIPEQNVYVDDRAESTYDNAKNAVNFMKEHGWKTGIIVTSPYHMKRSLSILYRITKKERAPIKWYHSSSTYSSFMVTQWWKDRWMRKIVVEEYMKLLAYKLKYMY